MRFRTTPVPVSPLPPSRHFLPPRSKSARVRAGRLLLLIILLLALAAMWISYLVSQLDSRAPSLRRPPPASTTAHASLDAENPGASGLVTTLSSLAKDPAFTSETISYHPVRASNQFFVSAGAYLVHADASRRGMDYTKTDDVLLIFIGFGDFDAKTPQPSSDELNGVVPKLPPSLECVLELADKSVVTLRNGVMHVNGTVYEQRKSEKRNVVYNFIERGVWISFLVPPAVVAGLAPMHHGHAASPMSAFRIPEWQFDSNAIVPYWYPSRPLYKVEPLVLCTSALWNMSGTKFLIEWLEYHLAIGFSHIVLYYDRVGPLTMQVIAHYQARGVVTAHDWGSILDDRDGFGFEGVGRGVVSRNWEHGQRIARNDCYLRYRHHSAFMGFIDVDEAFQSASGPFVDVVNWCKDAIKLDPMKIACSLKSVTVPPVATIPGDLLLQRMPVSEHHCQEPYNCGHFHEGREKYILRTDIDAVMPPGPVFYHGVSQNYAIARKHHVWVPREVGSIRHYAGHFAHSRKGGLPSHNRVFNPLPEFSLEHIRVQLRDRPELRALYELPQSERFLKLDAIEDAWRFTKNGERPKQIPPSDYNLPDMIAKYRAAQAPPRVVVVASTATASPTVATTAVAPPKRFLTFELFGGRLNNQIWTYDWVFRLALGLNRTAVLPRPAKREHWIGLPSSPAGASLWDLALLRSAPFSFVHWFEAEDEDLRAAPPAACTWVFSPENKYLVPWAARASALPACARRLHFATGEGLIHAYKADTRGLGVDPLVFWTYMRPSPRVLDEARAFVARARQSAGGGAVVGLHARTFLEAKQTAQGAQGVCGRLAKKLLDSALRRVRALARCGCGQQQDEAWVRKVWTEGHLEDGCSITDESLPQIAPVPSGAALVVATDHETKEMDELFRRHGGNMYFYPGDLPKLRLAEQVLGRDLSSLWTAIEPVLVDIGLLLLADEFYGTPSSTLSQAVCLWRRAMGTSGGDMCDLVWLSTYSDRCDEMEASLGCRVHEGGGD